MKLNSTKFNQQWNDKALVDLGRFARGKSKHRPRNDPRLFANGMYPLVQTGDVKSAAFVIRRHSATYNDFGLAQSELWPAGTLCITIAANIAETALLGYPMCFPDSVVGFKADPRETSETFMHYVFAYIRDAIQSSASGSIQDNINIEYLTSLRFQIPPLVDQRKIAAVLSALDAKIDLNNRINAELEALAKTIYDYWFVQFDFPDANGRPYKSSGGAMVWNDTLKRDIPAGWGVRRLRDLLQSSSEPVSAADVDERMPYTPIDALPKRRMSFGLAQPSADAKTSLIGYEKGDILIGAMRVYFHRVCIAPFDGVTRTTTIALRPIAEEQLPFLYQICNEDRLIDVASKLSVGTQQPYVNWEGSLENCEIPYPSDETLINRYCEMSSKLVAAVVARELENATLTRLRDWLLPLLMNGQVRVA